MLGRLQEGVEALGLCVLLYPKFHCELNFKFTERDWGREEWFARGNAGMALKETVLETLVLVTNDSARGFYRCC